MQIEYVGTSGIVSHVIQTRKVDAIAPFMGQGGVVVNGVGFLKQNLKSRDGSLHTLHTLSHPVANTG